jgi:hypothetical protein
MPLRTHSRVRRSIAVAASAVLMIGLAVTGISAPAEAAPVKGYLTVVSVTDLRSGLGAPVQDRPFDVVVEVVDASGRPTTVSKATTIVLEEVSGPGALGIRPRRLVRATALAPPFRGRRTPSTRTVSTCACER